ncbi:MAG: phosphonoacetaldehyde hydrolase [Klebsiella pneumoniae]|nr:phosphonoacetaldehyde hydrolase [Klebsiella pneumoniae]
MNRISALILDWAGTTVDFGSFAPTQIFVEAFRQAFDIEITLEEARVPMGLGKWQHIEALGKLPAVDSRWQAKFGRAMTAADIDAIYAAFMPLQIAKVVDFSAPIAGVVDTIATLRAKGLKIGSCSGYPRPVMEKLVAHCVKVDDAAPGISEGLHAGMWSVGLAVSGNEFGATWEEYQAMSKAEIATRRERAAGKLCAAGAHYVVDTLADLPEVIADINARLAKGERP